MGQVSGVYGVRGWLRVRSDCEPLEQLLDYSPWQLKTAAGWSSHALEDGKPHGPGLVAKLATVDDRDMARKLVGADIAVERSQLPALAEDEYYWNDLIGLAVVTHKGVGLGQVSRLMRTGANDVLVVKHTHDSVDSQERLIPYLPCDTVLRVDLAEAVIEVDWFLDED